MLRIATFNVENLFTRPRAFAMGDSPAGREAIEDFEKLTTIVEKVNYSQEDKEILQGLSQRYGFHLPNAPADALVRLQKIRGQLFTTSGGQLSVAATGRSAWTGWFELLRDDVGWDAVRNIGQVINAVRPDILICVEVEDRITLDRFNRQVLEDLLQPRYPHVMLIDGNDLRGIDVGILSRFPIRSIVSHVDDVNPDGRPTFNRDCPEFDIELSENGPRIVILANHFKSKRGGDSSVDQERRRLQGESAHRYAMNALARSPLVLVGGDLNDTPDSSALQELIKDGFLDVQSHPSYPTDRPGTFATGLASNKIDYLISSPALWAALQATGIERRGTYHPQLWTSFSGVGRNTEASDHHCVWADFNL